jgi:hypothetical protein
MVRCVDKKIFKLDRSGSTQVPAITIMRSRYFRLIGIKHRMNGSRVIAIWNRQENRCMFTRHQTLLLAALALAALLGAAPASAQNAQQNLQDERPAETTGSAVAPGVPPAPVGHRQPRASDIPADTQRTATDEDRRQMQRDRELDKKLWICRGC